MILMPLPILNADILWIKHGARGIMFWGCMSVCVCVSTCVHWQRRSQLAVSDQLAVDF